jgi:glucokinase
VILAGDVGATKILLEVGELRSGKWRAAHSQRIAMADVANFPEAISAFLAGWDAVKPPRARITAAGFGVAGPAEGNKVRMTHRPWVIDGDVLARRFAIARVRVVNDLAAGANGLDWLAPKDFAVIQPGKASAVDPSVVLGVGTGLGVAYLVPGPKGSRIVPGEGGHVGFSPCGEPQLKLLEFILGRRGRVEAEDIASGAGLPTIHEFLGYGHADAATIGAGALAGDADCVATVDLFTDCLGNVAGDQALALMARGGVFLAGGVLAKIAPALKKERFRAAFCAKGAFSSQLMRIPVRAVLNERVALLGAARFAKTGDGP